MNDTEIGLALAAAGVDPALSRHLRVEATPAPDGDRGMVAVGFLRGDRFVETAIVSTHDERDAERLVATFDRIAPLLALGARAMPRDERPRLAEEIARHPAAEDTRNALRRASSLAEDAARGRPRDEAAGNEDADGDAF